MYIPGPLGLPGGGDLGGWVLQIFSWGLLHRVLWDLTKSSPKRNAFDYIVKSKKGTFNPTKAN